MKIEFSLFESNVRKVKIQNNMYTPLKTFYLNKTILGESSISL